MAISTGQGSQLQHDEHHRKLHPPFAQPDPGRRATPNMAAESPAEAASADLLETFEPSAAGVAPSTQSDSLPSIDQFVDDLPAIDDFLLEVTTPGVLPSTADTGNAPRSVPPVTRSDAVIDNEGWAEADWQSYDWSRLASLGAPAPEAAEAHAAWSTTNWDSGQTARSEQSGYLREDEVAAALDEIARRIRSGELSLHQFKGSPPEAAMAAAFASLLRSRG
jgi:hypothetical protein